MSKAVYLGINTEFPIYETTTQEVNIPFNADNIDSIFHTTVTGNAFIKGVFTAMGAVTGISFGVNRDYSLANGTTVTYKEILTALYDINNVQIFFEGAVKSGYTALKVGSTSYTITTASSQTPVFSGNITAGTTIELTGYFYYSNFMPTAGYFGITADNIADTEEVKNIVGYEQKEVARKVKNIYIGGSVEKSQYGTKLEYIECTGTQYINTGVQPTNNTRVVLDADISYNATYQALFGSRITSTVNWLAFTYKNGKGFKVDYALATANPAASTLTNSGRHVIDMNRNTFTVDGTLYHTFTTETFSIALDMYLGTINVDGAPMTKNNSSMKIYSCKIYENDELVRDFIPCLTLNYEVGLFDQVNKIFYPNIGTGIFNAGAEEELIEPQLCPNIARKTNKGYIGVNNIARKFYSNIASFFSYTGDYTESSVEIEGVPHTLYALTSSGELKVEGEDIQFWICGGGGGGGAGSGGSAVTYNGTGGSGGRLLQDALAAGEYAVVIGAGGSGNDGSTEGEGGDVTYGGGFGGTTMIGNAFSAEGGRDNTEYAIRSGNAFGGCRAHLSKTGTLTTNSNKTGDGLTSSPFGLSALNYHCAGGGSGAIYRRNDTSSSSQQYVNGGKGGSNGSDSGIPAKSSLTAGGAIGGAGGSKGGGAGGNGDSSTVNGSAATFYGSGGGGGGHYYKYVSATSTINKAGTGGAGYQGVVYIAIPA